MRSIASQDADESRPLLKPKFSEPAHAVVTISDDERRRELAIKNGPLITDVICLVASFLSFEETVKLQEVARQYYHAIGDSSSGLELFNQLSIAEQSRI